MNTFASIPEEFAAVNRARLVVIPVPYDDTSSWGKGADKGPQALLDAADNMELYDIETDAEPFRYGIHLDAPVDENLSPEDMVDAVQDRVSTWLAKSKQTALIGGEHSVSIGAIKAYREQYPDLNVLQLDAHADLRPTYEGSAKNHACALHWASRNCGLTQVGIRSMDISEKKYLNTDRTWFAEDIVPDHKLRWIPEVVDSIDGPVYITIDLDVFDPSVLPATGTPEPGGLTWYPVLTLLREVISRKHVVGFDVVELAPHAGAHASAFTAAKLVYKLISYLNDEL